MLPELQVSPQSAARALLAYYGLLRTTSAVPWRSTLAGTPGVHAALLRLEAVQVDPISAVERNHHLVLYNRVGGYRPEHLDELFRQGQALEYLANARCILPIESFPDFWPIMLQARANSETAGDVLRRSMDEVLAYAARVDAFSPREVGSDGPRLMGIGYNPDDVSSKASGRAIDLLWLGGQIMVSGRRGNDKLYTLTERHLPPSIRQQLVHVPAAPAADAPLRPWSPPEVRPDTNQPWRAMLLERYLRAFGIADTGDFRFGWQKWPAAERRAAVERLCEEGRLVPVRIEGVRRKYYAVPEFAALLAEAPNWQVRPEVRFIAPLDQLLWRRERVQDLFHFSYTWEVYIPETKRAFGYYAMPILYGDRLVGRIDPKLHRKQRHLELRRIGFEESFTPDDAFLAAFTEELSLFAAFHGAERVSAARIDLAGTLRQAVEKAVQSVEPKGE
ncbi:MAG: winged helix-turn-helix domain-containing protein [Firmicutes bacterium]|nr:winged helix-turn-helix domain-containing protein [Bacillota bacterium]